ncbi:unnamed protein product, partial [Discosporangium mesarthrocarpum]
QGAIEAGVSSGSGGAKGVGKGSAGVTRVNTAAPLCSRDFGLRRWKEYAVLRHGGNTKFSKSTHGQEILMETASKIRAQEVEGLRAEVESLLRLSQELQQALQSETNEKMELQARVVQLENNIREVETDRRRWTRDTSFARGRGSNLERRLAGGAGGLRTFLFGPEA